MDILKYMTSIPNDKLLHSFYGTLVFILLSYFNSSFAIMATICIAVLKEVYDEVVYKGFSLPDICATLFIPFMIYVINLIK